MDSLNTIKEFFENQGGIKMELNTISGPVLLPIYVIEIGVFVMAAGTLVMALKMGRMEEL